MAIIKKSTDERGRKRKNYKAIKVIYDVSYRLAGS